MPVSDAVTDAARDAARTAGYADGWAQGQRAARVAARAVADQLAAEERAAAAARAEAVRRALAAVARAAAELDARRAPALAEIEDQVLHAAVEIATAIVGYEIAHAPDRPVTAVRRAMSLVPDGVPVTVRVHPDDHQTLVGAGGTTYALDGRAITVRADAALAPGDAVAEYGVTTIDASLAAAAARIREVLGR
jgi:flagellar assembly protein FliH